MKITDELVRNTLRLLKSRIRKAFYPWCRYLGWSRIEIEDWVEEMCGLGIALCTGDWNSDKSSFLSWAHTKTWTLARDDLKRENTQGKIIEALLQEPAPEYRNDLGQYLLRDQLLGLLEQLNPNYEEALSLFHLAELTPKEIAHIMDCPVQSVYTWLKRGLEKAREHWVTLNHNDEPSRKPPQKRPRNREPANDDDAEPAQSSPPTSLHRKRKAI